MPRYHSAPRLDHPSGVLEEFRLVAKGWIEAKRAEEFSRAIAALTPRPADPFAVDDDIQF